jgi:hypothetical protein
VRYIAWRHELLSNLKPAYKRHSPQEFMPLPTDEKIKKRKFEDIDQRLSEGLEKELFRVIGKIGS